MEHPRCQPFPEPQSHKSHKFDPPTYQPDHSCQINSIPSQPCQTYSSEEWEIFPTWSDENRQTQNAHLHQDQTCPDQLQIQPCPYQPHPQPSFEPTFDQDYYADSTAREIERTPAFQLNMQSCAESEAEMVMDMQHTYEERQSGMDDIIRQVALLTEMMKEMGQNRQELKADGKTEEDEKQKETSPSNGEEEAEALSEGAQPVEIDSDEEETLREEEIIPHGVKLNNTLIYLQTEEVQVNSEMVEECTTKVKEEKRIEEGPPPKT